MRGADVLPLTQRMLDRLPDYYSGDRFIEGYMDALGREIQRIWDRAAKIQNDFLLGTGADDQYGILSIWETLLGLPVAPPGISDADRLTQIRATLRAHNQASGAQWVASISYAMAGAAWTYQEGPAPYTITFFVPFSASSFTSVQIEKLLRAITPAHLEIAVEYNQGFVVGEGLVGEDRL